MWITLCLVSLVWVSTSQVRGGRGDVEQSSANRKGDSPVTRSSISESKPTSNGTQSNTTFQSICNNVLTECLSEDFWTRCYDNKIRNCIQGRIPMPKFIRRMAHSSNEAEDSPTPEHRVHIPSSALQKCKGHDPNEEVQLVITVLNCAHFKPSPPPATVKARAKRPVHIEGTVMGGLVLVVKAGNRSVNNLPQPIELIFKRNKEVENGTCVFWEELEDGTGRWSRVGSQRNNETHFICSCTHLSFFAVLVNLKSSVDGENAKNLSYITYVGSALSVFFTAISLIIYICLQRQRPEKAIGLHMQLTGALFCLHFSFLLSSFWVSLIDEEDWVCKVLGFFLHWSLLATISWTALEGFHLYLLLVRVFNIYIRRYLLKLSLVGWGFPTLIAVVCGISGVYGKYSLDKNGTNPAMQLCWMRSEFPHRLLVSYITTMAFPCLVILYNSCMLGLVVFKLWRRRVGDGAWNKMNREKGSRLWKDCATVLGLSCVLGLPWGLASTTYISLTGIYIFTILNSLQGVFVVLWSIALTCTPRSDNNSSTKDSASQKMMTTNL